MQGGIRRVSLWRIFTERPDDLHTWRVWFAKVLIVMGAVLYPLGSAFALPQYLAEGKYFLIFLNALVCVILLARCFSKDEDYVVNAFLIMTMLYIATTFYFIVLGPDHARPAWLVVCAVMAALLYGVRGAIVCVGLNIVLLLVLYEVMGPESAEWAAEYQTSYYQWASYVLNTTLLTIVSAVPTGYMLIRLDQSLAHEREAKKQLSEESLRLKEVNAAHVGEIELRRETEKVLREKEVYLRVLFEKAPDGYLLLGPEGRLVDVNLAVEKMFGYPKEEAVGKLFYETGSICPENISWAVALFNRHLQGKDLIPVEIELKRKDGRLITVELNAFPVTIKGEMHLLEIARDVTQRKREEQERKQLEQRLMQAQKMEAIGTLAGGIAHDFNNILTGVIGYSELALSDIGNEQELMRLLGEVLKAGNRAKDLVGQILTFSRYEGDQTVQNVKVKAVAEDVLNMMRATLPSTIEIRNWLESEVCVLADPVQLHQVLMNLCTNSGQAMMERGGVLEVRVSDLLPDADLLERYPELPPGPHVEIAVKDTGKGIEEEVMGKIFDPYFTTKPQGEGCGLGLSIVHGIVKTIGGVLVAQSEPGLETVFRIYLPAAGGILPESDKTEMVFPTGQERILFVDDEPTVIEIGQSILEKMGYRVEAKSSGVEAIESFENNPTAYDLVITDMTMPVMTGKELSERMMSIRSDIPIILCTGFSHQIDREKALEMGIKAFIIKPFNLQQLAEVVRNVLDDASSRA
jgi:PAS domain S-box-containing protein